MALTPKEILEIDAQRNHPPGTTAGHLMAKINNWLRAGGDIVQEGNVLIVYRTTDPGTVEFHTFNANAPKNLVNSVKSFASMLKKAGAKTMFTTYKNEKITDFFRNFGVGFDIEISKKNNIYTAKVSL